MRKLHSKRILVKAKQGCSIFCMFLDTFVNMTAASIIKKGAHYGICNYNFDSGERLVKGEFSMSVQH